MEIFVGHFAVQDHVPIPIPEGKILLDHGLVILRNTALTDGDLGHGEKDTRQLEGGAFHGFLRMPHGHIGMDGGISAHLSEMEHVQPVAEAVVGGIAGAEHIAEGTHQRADVGLTELDEHVGTDGTELLQNVLHQPIHRVVDGYKIHTVLDRIALGEAVDKVQFQTVNAPIREGGAVFADDVFPHLGIAGVQNPGFVIAVGLQHFILEMLVAHSIFPHKGNGVPQHNLHTDFVHLMDKLPHIGELFSRGDPVTAGAVHAALDGSVPSVVHDDGVAAQLVEVFALVKKRLGGDALVIGIPGGVQGLSGRLGNGGGGVSVEGFPPFCHVLNTLAEGKSSLIDADTGGIVRDIAIHTDEHAAGQAGAGFS